MRNGNVEHIIEQESPRYPRNKDMRHVHLRIATLERHRFGQADCAPANRMGELANSEREGCQEDNAKLIVKAPLMYELLQRILSGDLIVTREADIKEIADILKA